MRGVPLITCVLAFISISHPDSLEAQIFRYYEVWETCAPGKLGTGVSDMCSYILTVA
jgi:hypothetical protein